MNFKTEITDTVDSDLWEKTLLNDSNSTAYQLPDFFTPSKEIFNSKPVFILVYDASGKIVGQLSGAIHFSDNWLNSNRFSNSITSKLRLGYSLNWFYGPIIHDQENYAEILTNILTAIDKVAIENNVNLIRGLTPPQKITIPIEIFKKFNYSINPWITYKTDLTKNIDDIFNSLHKHTRYDIRKGENKGLVFEAVNTKTSFDQYADVKFEEKNKVEEMQKLHSRKLFLNRVWDTSYKNGHQKMFLARYEEKPIATIVNVIFNGNVVQMGVGNSPVRNLYGGSFLAWNTIKWFSEMNYKTYDVGGANPNPTTKKEEGINNFKSKWNSEKLDYFFCTKIFNKTKLNISNIIKQPKSIKHKISKYFH